MWVGASLVGWGGVVVAYACWVDWSLIPQLCGRWCADCHHRVGYKRVVGALLEQSLCLPTPFVVMCIGPWQCMPLLLISRFVSAAVFGLTPLALMIGCGERCWCAAVVLHGLCRSDRRRNPLHQHGIKLGCSKRPSCMRGLPVGFNSFLCNPVSSLA